jgi:hypothetical protein
VIAVFIFITGIVWAAPETAAEKTAVTNQDKSSTVDKKSTDMSFDELLVQGKYHFTGEAVTTVEQDKVLDGLLQVRKDFKDRIQQSAARY